MTHTAVSQVYNLLSEVRRHAPAWGQEYSWNLAKDRLQDLEKYGKAYVSRHEDRMGEGFSFGPDLLIIR